MTRQIALKRWTVLTLLVLLAHLGLLQSMPLNMQPVGQTDHGNTVFVTRTIRRAPIEVLEPVIAHPKPVQKIQRQPIQNKDFKLLKTEHAKPFQAAKEAALDGLLPNVQSGQSMPIAPVERAEVVLAAAVNVPQAAPVPAQLPFKADKLSPSARLIYTVKTSKFPFPLSGQLLWRNLGGSYTARLRYSMLGITRQQTSRGQISAAGLAPERFADKFRTEVAAHFNYPQGRVTFSANTPEAPLLPGAQDRLSVLLQLGAMLASEPTRFLPGNSVSIQTIGPRAADLWLFTIGNSELLELPGGTMSALKLERQPRELYDQKVEVWLAPQLAYLPARIRISDTNGDQIDQMWTSTESAEETD